MPPPQYHRRWHVIILWMGLHRTSVEGPWTSFSYPSDPYISMTYVDTGTGTTPTAVRSNFHMLRVAQVG